MKRLITAAAIAVSTLVLAAQPGVAAEAPRLLQLAQAEASADVEPDAVARAEAAVEAARARLREAMAGKGNVREARQALREALARLEEARAAADSDEETAEESTDGDQEDGEEVQTETAGEDETATEAETAIEAEAPTEADTATEAGPPTEAETAAEVQESEEPVELQEAEDGRVIVREGSQIRVESDDSQRLQQGGGRRRVEQHDDGTTTATVVRPNGAEVVTIRNDDGDILQRYRRTPNGEVQVLIGDPEPGNVRRQDRGGQRNDGPIANFQRLLPRLQITIPQQEYIVESDEASDQDLERALLAPPVEQVERSYSLSEIRRSGRLRSKLRRIDVNTVTFDFGSADIAEDQVWRMDQIGNALNRILSRNPGEVILIEGHTDAVGSNFANLALSDRRAESVAGVLAAYYGVPPENLVTQGYGEEYLKVPTAGPERENRRVTLRRITPLLRGAGYQ